MIIQHSLATFHVDSISKFEDFATHINFTGNLSLAPLNNYNYVSFYLETEPV